MACCPLKQWLRTRIVSALSYDPSNLDSLAACAEPGSDKFGRIDKAHGCYLPLRSHFELGEIGIAWRREQATKGGAASSMYFHWASYQEETKGLRPKGPCGTSAPGTTTSVSPFASRRATPTLIFNSTELRLVMFGGGGGALVEVQGRKQALRLLGETQANGRAWCR